MAYGIASRGSKTEKMLTVIERSVRAKLKILTMFAITTAENVDCIFARVNLMDSLPAAFDRIRTICAWR